MELCRTKLEDIDYLIDMFKNAISYMRSYGNLEQWNDFVDIKGKIIDDINKNQSYILKKDNKIVGYFVFMLDKEPTYKQIEGEWLNDKPYGTIHRIISSFEEKDVLKEALDYAFKQIDNVRIDTHKDNKPMRHLLEKYGFNYCGIITLDNKQKRLAFQKEKHGN